MAPPVPGPTEGLNAAVAAEIRAEAAAKKMTDKALAKKADVNYASLRRWIGKDAGNERHLDVAHLAALADALDISASELVRRAQERLPRRIEFNETTGEDSGQRVGTGTPPVDAPRK